MNGRLARTVVGFLPFALLVFLRADSSPAAVIQWKELYQVIDGFGGSCADFSEALPPKMADFFFTTSGIGLSLLRIQVIPSMAECKSFFNLDGDDCLEVASGTTILRGELAIAKQAVARGGDRVEYALESARINEKQHVIYRWRQAPPKLLF